jgi:F-type H+-transporting ATPase subunit delta
MRGVSATSRQSTLDIVERSTGEPAQLGDELFAVASALDATPSVRRMLTDPATEPDARSGMAAAVFGGKIAPATLAVLDVAARGRWASSRDLSDTIEDAGVAAHVAAASAAGTLDSLEDELFEAARLILHEPELRGILGDRTIATDRKAPLIESIFGGKVTDATLALLKQAAAARRGAFESVLHRFADEVAARRDRVLAEVRSSYELGDSERERLAQALTARYGRDVQLNVVVDPSIIGGLRVVVGDEVIDGTVATRLEDVRRRLAG